MISTAELMEWLRAEPEDYRAVQNLERAAVEFISQGGRYFGPRAEIVEEYPYRGGAILLGSEPLGAIVVEEEDAGAWVALTDHRRTGRLLYLTGDRRYRPPAFVRVTYEAGGEPDPADPEVWDAPEPIRQAVRMLVADWYKNREGYKQTGQDGAAVQVAALEIVRRYA
jgi:hypothetical protein